MRSFIQKLTLNVQSYLDLFLHGSSSSFYNPWWYQQRYQEWSYWVENLHVSFGVPIKKAHKFEWYRKTCYRSSRQEVICEKSVLRNFKKFTGKHLCWNLFFNKVSGLRPATFLKKRLWHKCFPVNIEKFLRTPFVTEHLLLLLLLLKWTGRSLKRIDFFWYCSKNMAEKHLWKSSIFRNVTGCYRFSKVSLYLQKMANSSRIVWQTYSEICIFC